MGGGGRWKECEGSGRRDGDVAERGLGVRGAGGEVGCESQGG